MLPNKNMNSNKDSLEKVAGEMQSVVDQGGGGSEWHETSGIGPHNYRWHD